MIGPFPLISRYHASILSLQPRDKATMLGASKKRIVFSKNLHENRGYTSQGRDMLLFLTTKMAAV